MPRVLPDEHLAGAAVHLLHGLKVSFPMHLWCNVGFVLIFYVVLV